jgi:hypothetical protein
MTKPASSMDRSMPTPAGAVVSEAATKHTENFVTTSRAPDSHAKWKVSIKGKTHAINNVLIFGTHVGSEFVARAGWS